LLSPGFVDCQVNGGGGVMLNDDPSPATVNTIVKAHHARGTTSLLPTLISDAREKIKAAISAVDAAKKRRHPGHSGAGKSAARFHCSACRPRHHRQRGAYGCDCRADRSRPQGRRARLYAFI
jgi:hypothetical protein